MKKSVLVLGFLVSALLTATPAVEMDQINNDMDDLPIKMEKVAFKTDMLKAKFIKVQLKQSDSLTKKIKFLKELKPIIVKMEKNIEK